MSSVETAFGLTEEQRLAKEEEEMNVALVEIQLRDEHSFPALGVSGCTLITIADAVYLYFTHPVEIRGLTCLNYVWGKNI